MSDPRWRCFVSIGIGDALRAELRAGVTGWQRRPDLAQLRWTDAEAWHVTLAFLGSTEPERVPTLLELLREVAASRPPLRMATGGLGGFPSAARARVAWLGIADPHGALAALAYDLHAALELDTAGPFRAHVTLARARHAPVDLRGWMASVADATPRAILEVRRLGLMRSHLARGATHPELLGSVPLGEPALV